MKQSFLRVLTKERRHGRLASMRVVADFGGRSFVQVRNLPLRWERRA